MVQSTSAGIPSNAAGNSYEHVRLGSTQSLSTAPVHPGSRAPHEPGTRRAAWPLDQGSDAVPYTSSPVDVVQAMQRDQSLTSVGVAAALAGIGHASAAASTTAAPIEPTHTMLSTLPFQPALVSPHPQQQRQGEQQQWPPLQQRLRELEDIFTRQSGARQPAAGSQQPAASALPPAAVQGLAMSTGGSWTHAALAEAAPSVHDVSRGSPDLELMRRAWQQGGARLSQVHEKRGRTVQAHTHTHGAAVHHCSAVFSTNTHVAHLMETGCLSKGLSAGSAGSNVPSAAAATAGVRRPSRPFATIEHDPSLRIQPLSQPPQPARAGAGAAGAQGRTSRTATPAPAPGSPTDFVNLLDETSARADEHRSMLKRNREELRDVRNRLAVAVAAAAGEDIEPDSKPKRKRKTNLSEDERRERRCACHSDVLC